MNSFPLFLKSGKSKKHINEEVTVQPTYVRCVKSILNFLDKQNLMTTFFCVGVLTKEFLMVARLIADKGDGLAVT